MTDHRAVEAVRGLLNDALSRVREQVEQLCATATPQQLTYRVDPDANTIAWLVWHLTRIEDDHVCGLAGGEQVWLKDGWYDRFGLPFDWQAHGYGMSTDEVGKIKVAPELLDGYHRAVHAEVLRYVDSLTVEELDRVVDTQWDPPVTAGVRLVSVIGDCQAHLGQAEYVQGAAERAGVRD